MKHDLLSAFRSTKATKSFRKKELDESTEEKKNIPHITDLQPVDSKKQTYNKIMKLVAVAACMIIAIGLYLAADPELIGNAQDSHIDSDGATFTSPSGSAESPLSAQTLSATPSPTAMNGSGSLTLSDIRLSFPEGFDAAGLQLGNNHVYGIMVIQDEFYFTSPTSYIEYNNEWQKRSLKRYTSTIYHYDLVSNTYTPISDEVYGYVLVKADRFIYQDENEQYYSNNTAWNDEKLITREEAVGKQYEYSYIEDDITVTEKSSGEKYICHFDNTLLELSQRRDYRLDAFLATDDKLYFHVYTNMNQPESKTEFFSMNLDGTELKKIQMDFMNPYQTMVFQDHVIYVMNYNESTNKSVIAKIDEKTGTVSKLREMDGHVIYCVSGSRYLVGVLCGEESSSPHTLFYCPLNE